MSAPFCQHDWLSRPDLAAYICPHCGARVDFIDLVVYRTASPTTTLARRAAAGAPPPRKKYADRLRELQEDQE